MGSLLYRTLGTGRLILAIAAVGGPAASAESTKVKVLVPQIRPAAPPELSNRFHESVSRGWGSMEELLSVAEVRLRLGTSESLLHCSGQPTCAPQAAELLKTSRLLAVEIEIAGKDYAVHLRLVDSMGHELLTSDEKCEICTLKEAEEAAVRAAARLALAARNLPPEPAAAPDSKAAPQTGPQPTSAVGIAPGSATRTARPPTAKSSFPFRPVAIASAVGGLVLLIAGIPLSVIDGRPTCDRPDPVHTCPEVYNTAGGGAVLVALGALGLVASVPLFYFDARSRQRKLSGLALRLGLQPSGGAMALSGRF